MKSYVAFNADQVEGLPEHFHPKHQTRRAFPSLPMSNGSPSSIGMPPLAAFDDAETYAATLNHETVHATAAPHRMGRDLSKRFREAIAAEELVAEIGAAILGAHLRMAPSHIFDHAAYIENWMNILQSDKRAFFHAAAQAQLAVDWLLAKGPAPDETDVQA